jgi:hypothetical protein
VSRVEREHNERMAKSAIADELKKDAASLYQQQEVHGLGLLGATLGSGPYPVHRPAARQQLLERASEMRVQADQLTRLAMAIPIDFHPGADQALNDIIKGRLR